MITIANALDVTEAYLIKSRLDAEGIEAFIPDENTSQIQPLWNNVIGGVRIQVSDEDVEDAKLVLKDYYQQQNQVVTPVCPNCGSSNTFRDNSKQNWAIAIMIMIGIPLPLKNQLACRDCGHHWREKQP